MKHEWRKQEKSLYIPKKTEITEVPVQTFLVLEGTGNPNNDSFKFCIETLYQLSYGIKMAPKKGITIEGYYDYTVYPLEGDWSLTEKGISLYKDDLSIIQLKNHLKYRIKIRQPEFVTKELFSLIQNEVYKKKKNPLINDIIFEQNPKRTVCQTVHIGSYDSEPMTFKEMEFYTESLSYKRVSKDHTEIYLSDPRKTETAKLKTLLRFDVKKTLDWAF